MPAKISAFKNLKQHSPAGDLGVKDDPSLHRLFPHPIAKGSEWRSSKLIPAKKLRYMVGGPAMVETGVAPGIGGKMPSGKKSVAWKAVISSDETLTGHMTPKQVANVDSVTTPAPQTPSKFAAKVGIHAGGNQGVNLDQKGESKFGTVNYRMSNIEGKPGPSARSSRWAANVGHMRTAPQVIADKRTRANATTHPLHNYEMIETLPAKNAKAGKASRKHR